MRNRYRVNVRKCLNGPIVRVIDGISPDRPARALACELMRAGERNLTITVRSQRKAGQVIAGGRKPGWYCEQGNYPVYFIA